MRKWQKEKIEAALEKFSKKETLALIDSLDPLYWSDRNKEDARNLVRGGD